MQYKAIQCSAVSSLTIDDAAVGWTIQDYMHHQVVFTNLASITVTPTVYPAIAGGSTGYTATDVTNAKATALYNYDTDGMVNKIVLAFDSAFTGYVFFGSAKSADRHLI